MEQDKIISRYGKKGHYELSSTSDINTDPETAFSFFSSPLNLGLTTPSWVGFQIKEAPESIRVGSLISYTINVLGIPFRWVAEIIAWEPIDRFIDVQTRGPYNLWCHEHKILRDKDGRTVMEDRVIYTMPLGIIGRVIHRLIVMDQLKRIFRFRQRMIMLRFGGSNQN
jgi:ligand-binding SRPBCC domain-containing protein